MPVISESFEGDIPVFHTFQAKYDVSTEQAHTGEKSLLISPEPGKTGGAYFRLSDKLIPGKSYEFSAKVRASEGTRVSFYLSAAIDNARKILATTSGGEPGKWIELKGSLRGADWTGKEHDLMLAMVANGPVYFDDVLLHEVETVEPPITSWPKTLAKLKAAADLAPHTLTAGKYLTLRPSHGVLSRDLNKEKYLTPAESSVEIAADGALVFALDLPAAAVVTGAVTLKHGADLRPGLRAFLLLDSTLVATPMVSAAPWSNIRHFINDAAPTLAGRVPPESFSLVNCTLRAGRHYLIIAGPGFRAAGEFYEVTLQAAPVKDHPLYTFAFFTDTHLGEGRPQWMNTKLCGPAIDQLKQTLDELHGEAVDFAFLGGDLVDSGTASQYSTISKIIRESGMIVYGVMGNHDTFQPTSRADQAKIASDLFPGGQTYYVLNKAPLRFIILDKAYWRNPAGKIMEYPAQGFTANTIIPEETDWLMHALYSDLRTPTVVICHFPFFANPGAASSGYQVVSWAITDKSTELITKAPNVVATLSGHTHWNQVGKSGRITWIQNAAYVEWPAMYRMFRVYPDHLEWETRLVSNLGFVRESLIPEKGLTWMISTEPGDLAGSIRLP